MHLLFLVFRQSVCYNEPQREKGGVSVGYFLVIIGAYLLGCSNMAYYIARMKKVDARAGGSGNLGASNAVVLLGWKAGVLTAVHDIGKASLAVLLAKWLFPELERAGAAAGVACVLGHIFPFYLKFRGGKGFASYFGMTLALNWKLALLVGIAIVVVTIVTDYIVCGTLTTIVTVPLYMGFTKGWAMALILGIATAVILYKHRENFPRMLNGTELGLRSAIKGENRIK